MKTLLILLFGLFPHLSANAFSAQSFCCELEPNSFDLQKACIDMNHGIPYETQMRHEMYGDGVATVFNERQEVMFQNLAIFKRFSTPTNSLCTGGVYDQRCIAYFLGFSTADYEGSDVQIKVPVGGFELGSTTTPILSIRTGYTHRGGGVSFYSQVNMKCDL